MQGYKAEKEGMHAGMSVCECTVLVHLNAKGKKPRITSEPVPDPRGPQRRLRLSQR
jgi:hypothetical protein